MNKSAIMGSFFQNMTQKKRSALHLGADRLYRSRFNYFAGAGAMLGVAGSGVTPFMARSSTSKINKEPGLI